MNLLLQVKEWRTELESKMSCPRSVPTVLKTLLYCMYWWVVSPDLKTVSTSARNKRNGKRILNIDVTQFMPQHFACPSVIMTLITTTDVEVYGSIKRGRKSQTLWLLSLWSFYMSPCSYSFICSHFVYVNMFLLEVINCLFLIVCLHWVHFFLSLYLFISTDLILCYLGYLILSHLIFWDSQNSAVGNYHMFSDSPVTPLSLLTLINYLLWSYIQDRYCPTDTIVPEPGSSRISWFLRGQRDRESATLVSHRVRRVKKPS